MKQKHAILLSILFSIIALNTNAFKPEVNFVKGEVLCRIYNWEDTSTLKAHSYNFSIEVLSQDLKLICLHFDPTKHSEQQVMQTLEEQFVGRLSGIQLNHNSRLRSTQPNDRSYSNQQLFWELVSAHKAWTKATGGTSIQGDTIVIAMVDDGLDTTHLDIQKNIWRNHNEIPNDGIDNDNNGYIDDYYGWNSYDNNGKLIEKDERARHGTPVAGLMGADGNNDSGITGGNWNLKILTVVGGSTDEADNILAFEYVRKMKKMYLESNGNKGAFVVGMNCSWGIGGVFPNQAPLWCAYFDTLGAYGISTVGATANSETDVGISGDMPSLCTSDHLIMVTNVIASTDTKRQQAGYNKDHIDLGAPGEGSYSLCAYSQGGCGSPYTTFGGTSGASPIVCAQFGLIYNYACDSFIRIAKNDPARASKLANEWIKKGVDSNSSLQGITTTGGRVNYEKTLIEVEKWCQSVNQPVDTETLTLNNGAIQVYPNPNFSQFNIKSDELIQQYEIFSINGILIERVQIPSVKEIQINLQLSNGIYFVRVKTENQQKAIRLQVY